MLPGVAAGTLAVMLLASQQDVGSHADGIAAGRWQSC